jgi:hypothetical protein
VRVRGASAVNAAVGAWQHSLIGLADGAVVGIGSNVGGQLGDGTTTLRLEPVPVTGLNLASNLSLLEDPDDDGLPTWLEYTLGFDPLAADTNGNGFTDLAESMRSGHGSDPDEDGDGVPSYLEALTGTDPFRADTDGDGVNDRVDAFPLDPTRSQLPEANPNDTTPPVITLTEPASARPRQP